MALRYFRFTVHPLSPARGAVDGKVELRLQFLATGKTIWHRFADGEWFSIADDAMGAFGVHVDWLRDIDTPGEPLFFQEGVFDPPDNPPQGVIAFTSLLGTAPSGPDNPAPG